MKIEIKQKVDIPVSPFCKHCYRKEIDKNGSPFCTLFNRFIFMHNGDYLKCRECYVAVYDALEKE